MSGITYFCTDRFGHVYTRYSVAHVQPRYQWAVIERVAGTTGKASKACVSYSSNRQTCANIAARAKSTGWHNFRTNKIDAVEAEVVEVRAYNHRLKEEPVGALEVAAAQMPQADADPIVAEQRDLLPFWEKVNAELKSRGQPEVLFGDIRRLAELFSNPVDAACYEIWARRQEVLGDYYEAEKADAQQGRGE
jgi:hypothetical protein